MMQDRSGATALSKRGSNSYVYAVE